MLGGLYWGGMGIGKHWDGKRQKWAPQYFKYLMTTVEQAIRQTNRKGTKDNKVNGYGRKVLKMERRKNV